VLSRAEKLDILADLEHYPDRQAAAVDALKIVQKHRGWVADDRLQDVAQFLQLSPTELEGVATFYNLIYRRPVGRHVILLCNSVSCWMLGQEALSAAFKQRLGIEFGETSSDGRFTLLPVPCLGTCDHAPALLIDDHLHRDVDPEQLEAILRAYD
jgi:NADH-quinone oxidoreductase subunit E